MKKRGFVLLAILLIVSGLMTVGIALTSAVSSTSIKIQRQYKRLSALAYSEAGVQKGLWKINQGTDTAWLNQAKTAQGKLESDITGGQYRVWIKNCTPVSSDCNYVVSTGFLPTEAKPDADKTVRVKINGADSNTTLNFQSGAQSFGNEINLANNAEIDGSAYSVGPIRMGGGNSEVEGNAVSYGNTPATSYISDGSVDGNAAAFTITGTDVWYGTKTTGKYPTPQAKPIADADLNDTIDGWEASALAGGTFTGNKTVSGNTTLGPIWIDGNLTISNNAQVKLLGNVWVSGNITINNNARVYLDSSFGNNSAVMIADYKQNRADYTKGIITVSNNATISGSNKNNTKTPSFTLMFSTQTTRSPASSYWKTNYAINVSNNANGGVFYAPFGSYHQSNVAHTRAVVANGIILDTNAVLSYDGNWGNSTISGGPSGKWTITEWLILD